MLNLRAVHLLTRRLQRASHLITTSYCLGTSKSFSRLRVRSSAESKIHSQIRKEWRYFSSKPQHPEEQEHKGNYLNQEQVKNEKTQSQEAAKNKEGEEEELRSMDLAQKYAQLRKQNQEFEKKLDEAQTKIDYLYIRVRIQRIGLWFMFFFMVVGFGVLLVDDIVVGSNVKEKIAEKIGSALATCFIAAVVYAFLSI